ncbi:MAG: S8 family serine peptidase [Clostridium sp.]|nr:S8 family serine peptidase [Clostridium sp.]MCM1547280.1 S8 family serine peptidase [Ruminococcus sp.]
MKKILSAISAAVFAAALIMPGAAEASASYVYNDEAFVDASHYCIIKLSDDPLAKYDYAVQNGVDDFIFTDEGKAAYEDLIEDHRQSQQIISMYLGRNVEKIYDYTAVYNGFSVLMSDSEYEKIALNKDSFGIENIYQSDYYGREIIDPYLPGKKAEESYSDLTNEILSQSGISSVGYKGDSTVIAVIDNEFDAEHEFLSTMPEGVNGRLDKEFIDKVSPYLSATSGMGNDYYLNEKIPYRFNYQLRNTDTSGDTGSFHGTHVAGIAAGNGDAETDEKYDAKGTAPNAQLLLMSSDLTYYCIMAAYDDCAYLGADAVNASYGEPYTSVSSAPYEEEAISNLCLSGTVFCAASGNAGKIDYIGKDSLKNTDYATGGTPEGISSALSVGSAANIVFEANIITVGGKNYKIDPGSSSIIDALGNSELEMEYIPNMGNTEDFEGIDLNGKIALIERGEISFDTKAQNAKDNGAVGVIFINNVYDENINVQCSVLPNGIIGINDGKDIIASGEKSVTINSGKRFISSNTNKMSGFSSWGYTEDLLLKPDITAYGGNIVSSYPNNKYGSMSGTSMAAPQMTGMTALLKEHLKNNKEKYGIEKESDYPEMIAKLLMSTASPVYSSDGLEIASPRVQGSGLANVEYAVNTPAYLYTDSEKDNFRPKLSLGDNLGAKIGTPEFSNDSFCFHIKNISDTPQTYSLSADLFRDDISEDGLSWNVSRLDKSKVTIKSPGNEITVKPGEDVTVNLDISMDNGDITFINENFENGTFIDGYIYLKNDSAPDLTLPFTGFYGVWNDADIFEPFVYDKGMQASMYPSLMCDNNLNPAGVSVIAAQENEIHITRPFYSPNGDNILDSICLQAGFKRRCKNVTAEIWDDEMIEPVYTEKFTLDVGSWSLGNDQEPFTTIYPIGWDFSGATEGKTYQIKLTAEKPLENDKKKESIIQEFTIDLTAPTIQECKKIVINGQDYMYIRSRDNYAVQGAVMMSGENIYDIDPYVNSRYSEYLVLDSLLKIPENTSGAYAEVYDMAGNCTKVAIEDIEDTYDLNFDENMYFSTNDTSFKNKINFTDSSGKNVNYSVSATPKEAYSKGITEISISFNSYEILSGVPVKVGLAGDADMNGIVDLYDAIKIAKYMVWQKNPNSQYKNEFIGFEGSFEEYLSDCDKDGKIGLYDAVEIAKMLLPQKQ